MAERRPTIKDIAEQLGLSTSTVSRAINDSPLISRETKERVVSLVKKTGYIRNNLARSLVLEKTQLIGLIIPDISDPFFSEIARGVQDEAHRKGYALVLCNTDRNLEKEKFYVQTLLENRVSGLILAGGIKSNKHLRVLEEYRTPFILAGRKEVDIEACSVLVDNFDVGFRATQYLINLGHRRIAHISGPADSATSRDRLQGYVQAMKVHGLVPRVLEGDFRMETGFALATEVLKARDRASAIFAANDLLAIGFILGAINSGIRVPEELSVVGCDDIPLARLINPKLTTVRIPMYEIGVRAMDMLLGLMSDERDGGGENVVLGCELIVRGSTGEARRGG